VELLPYEVETCIKTGKICYGWRHAKYELERVKKEGHVAKGFHLEIYYCPHCRRFHIGSRINRKKIRTKESSNNSEFEDNE